MAWPSSLQTCLKEWASICNALEQGSQIILLRKGGIREEAGEFEVEHRQFLLFPTYIHQSLKMLKPIVHGDFEARTEEPGQVRLSVAGVVTDIIQVKSRPQMDALDNQHVWATPLIDMRFNYRPENPLYLLLIRAYRLHEPQIVDNLPSYAGCKSWVPLDREIATGNPMPVLDDVKFELKRRGILDRTASA